MTFSEFLERSFWASAFLCLCVVASYFIFLLFMSGLSSGRVEYCYIEAHVNASGGPNTYRLIGFRNWRNNLHVGTFPSIEDAKKSAEIIDCPLY